MLWNKPETEMIERITRAPHSGGTIVTHGDVIVTEFRKLIYEHDQIYENTLSIKHSQIADLKRALQEEKAVSATLGRLVRKLEDSQHSLFSVPSKIKVMLIALIEKL